MSKQGYKKQENLSFLQLLSEVPSFIVDLVSVILSGTLLVFVDFLDSLSYIIRNAMVVVLSKKLSKDLRFEYNYGIGKIEAVSSLFCDGIVLFGLFLTFGLSVYSIFFPSKPSNLLIVVAGFKLYDVIMDVLFLIKQRKILKIHHNSISETNYAAALGALLFDGVTLISLLFMWLLRNNPVGGYISPVVSIFIAMYLTIGCIKRIRSALTELTDKTLPEEQQLKILNILNRHYDSYSQLHFINSHKSGDFIRIDLHLSFEKSTSFEEIVNLKEQLKNEFDSQFDHCIVNLVVERD